jgi:hypothetical protein
MAEPTTRTLGGLDTAVCTRTNSLERVFIRFIRPWETGCAQWMTNLPPGKPE